MKNRLMTLAALALTFASCATTTVSDVQPLTLKASDVQPLTLKASAVTVPGGWEYPAHILICAALIDGEEAVQIPKVIVLPGQRASAFVGEIGPYGKESGFQLDVLVVGDVAQLEASELRMGEVLRREVQTIPVEPAAQDS